MVALLLVGALGFAVVSLFTSLRELNLALKDDDYEKAGLAVGVGVFFAVVVGLLGTTAIIMIVSA